MARGGPSIQSFFPSRAPPSKGQLRALSPNPGDGFTQEELDTSLTPLQQDNWVPSANYDEFDIDSLVPGPSRIKIMGRIVNLFESSPKTKLSAGAKGSLHLVVKDDTGVVTIKLSDTMLLYEPQLGQLVAIWATYIANGDKGSFPCAVAPLYIKIFPEKDKSSHIRILDVDESTDLLCRKPIDHEYGLMSLKNFIQGGFEVKDSKVLVVVKSISARRKKTKKDGTQVHLVEVGLMDDTDGAVLSLWGIASTSSNQWRPSQTVLLITSPGLNVSHKNWLALASDTFIDVDPDISGATTLRTFAGRMIRRQSVNSVFPHEEYDAWVMTRPNEHVLYTLADVDDRARERPGDEFEGYLSMIIVELNMTTLRQQNMLMCNECCGIPLYANSTTFKCKHCDKQVPLRINPRLIGKLVDESGCIGTGKLMLSDYSWTRLLGRTAEDLIHSSASELKHVEHRMLHARITLRFWWSSKVGKLVISEVLE
ncbi:hypothetical protein AUEXF2481DRAFT_4437 [Aureobasidium subglaciale EXF-2481]|uniref:Uncharacterized protein n=1 Tax=Aureobasidium subglaciale (strain EXF-2481) TaxID=1043005 RepID=A0A074YEH3_AURSE|nr:uncharacterized protein AUEXF2481DRAFT_4437 [Aureobasidium subglaciale EXF-2481]KEQ96193.1 hypothetical protein AUEXF2481DRAFT_4437 [Aureobasidium subglaciale EXF-2481]